ncbi:MAG: hypothetical protein LPD71_05840 [Shewanella sp.]|nr:hypothetical protein [Shewanella sp.]MCF1459611.1 hypothetical protein [Shewanella sp.]
MPTYAITGKLGSGKSLVAVSRIQEYLNQGRPVATNLDLNLEFLVNPFAKTTKVSRLPDRPSVDDLSALGYAYEGDYDESKTGAIVLDELGTWMNSRSWKDKGRKETIDWLIHARKYGWDVYMLVQDISIIDAQVREGLAEHVVYCRRLDRLSIPLVTWFFGLAGLNVRFPKCHFGIVKYGISSMSPTVDRWVYKGTSLYAAYDTRQIFQEGSCGLHSMLPPNTIYGRYTNGSEHFKRRFINSINKHSASFKPRGAFFVGLSLAGALAFFLSPAGSVVSSATASPGQLVLPSKDSSPAHPLEGLFITASVKYSSGFDYVFETSESVVYPENHGYKVRWIESCKASLYSDKETLTVTCSPLRIAPVNDSVIDDQPDEISVSE